MTILMLFAMCVRSPLAEGRELKSVMRITSAIRRMSPLAEGRELKYALGGVGGNHAPSPLAEGRELKCFYFSLKREKEGRPSRRGVN